MSRPAASTDAELAFVVPTLGAGSDQDEDVMQLLLFAGARVEQAMEVAGAEPLRARVLVVDGDTSGWEDASELLAPEVLPRLLFEAIPEPEVPGLATGCHKAAYDLLEYARTRSFAELHCLDHGGVAYYVTQARRLGMDLLATPIAVHVVGATVFRAEADDRMLDRVEALADDVLERGSIERADALFVHDERAWDWYTDKITVAADTAVHHLRATSSPGPSTEQVDLSERPFSVAYFGSLSADGGLPLFIDSIERLSQLGPQPAEVLFVGPAGCIGGMDAVSYTRLRSARWGLPVRILRNLSLAEELAFLAAHADIVICDTRRRQGLRARLAVAYGLPVLQVTPTPAPTEHSPAIHSDNPNEIAALLASALRKVHKPVAGRDLRIGDIWRGDRQLPTLIDLSSPEPLRPPAEQPSVSVCLIHHSRPRELRAALRSLEAQSYENFEVVVVDDGSPDVEVQRELDDVAVELSKHGWRLVRQPNRYPGAARNTAARHATGEFLLFMDDDNLAMPSELATLVAVACRTGADIVTTFYDGFEGNGPPAGSARASVRFPPFGAADPALGIFTNCFGDANALFRRGSYEGLGGFTEDYGITHEDWELFCRAALDGLSLVCVPRPLFWYRMDGDGMFLGQRKQLHELANRRRHTRPHQDRLPYHQAKLVQLVQGLTTDEASRGSEAMRRAAGAAVARRHRRPDLPFARVAVIVRTRDRPVLLRRALRSILDQTFRDWRLVIVNDGGSPAAVQLVLDELAGELDDRVCVRHNAVSLGMQTAANVGAMESSSELIVLHDDDDSWDPGFLDHAVSYFDEHGWDPALGGVVTLTQLVVEDLTDDGELVVRDSTVFNPDLETVTLTDLAVENRFPPISFLFRRAAFESVGPFDQTWGPLGDWEFHLRLLTRFDIRVVPLVLANYHHRGTDVGSAYGNSVHAETGLHRSMRSDLVNKAARQVGGTDGPLSLLLVLGELQHRMEAENRKDRERFWDSIWTLEQSIDRVARHVGALDATGRNLAENGDFRVWPGPGPVQSGAHSYGWQSVCPRFLVSFDGAAVSYRLERHRWAQGDEHLSSGKTYLHLENDGSTRAGSWFTLECTVPGASELSGRTICISAVARLDENASVSVGGRYHLRDGRRVSWPTQAVPLTQEFRRWSVTLSCPAVDKVELRSGAARVILKLPHDRPFVLDLTDFQVEIGGLPTSFWFRPPLRLRHRRDLRSGVDGLRRLINTLRR